MSFNVSNKNTLMRINRYYDMARQQEENSLIRMSSGDKFSGRDKRVAERYLSDRLSSKLKSLSNIKQSINNAVSLLQTADSGMQEVGHIVNRMKEIALSGASTTVDDRDRRYLFVEYEALLDEMNRIAETTEFNGIPILNGDSEKTPEQLVFILIHQMLRKKIQKKVRIQKIIVELFLII